MKNRFDKRVFGAVLIKSELANYNADFTGSPRTLPNGVVYATDKALKYAIRNYLKHNGELIFYTTRYKKENMQPLDIDETYEELFGNYPEKKEIKKNKNEKEDKYFERIKKEVEESLNKGYEKVLSLNHNYLLKKEENGKLKFLIIGQKPDDIKRIPILQNLFKAIDIRFFGVTFASKEGNLSIHGNIQITHGINIYPENNIFTEDITSPFRNPNEKSESSQQTSIGNQTILEEGHYLHNFTINPKNSEELVELIGNQGYLTDEDIEKFKEAINRGVSYYDSASKVGVENEFSIFVTLNQNEKIQLPLFTPLIKVKNQENSLKRKLNLSDLKKLLDKVSDRIEKVEIFMDETKLDCDDEIFAIPKVCVKSIVSNRELKKCQE